MLRDGISWVLLLLFPLAGWAQCAPAPAFYGYRFLNPRVVEFDSRLAPFFVHYGEIYRDELTTPAGIMRQENVAEWYERYCEEVLPKDIEALIYNNNLNQMLRLQRTLLNEEATVRDVPVALQSSSFARHLVRYGCREVVDYLIYAKRCEPFVTRTTDPFRATATPRREMEELIDDGLEVFNTLESHYVRLRYAYQIIRLAHYLGAYAYVLELYEYLIPKIEADPSIVYDWIEGHRAGALQALGRYPESAYLYSRIFERCPSKRESAYRSFRIQTDEQWRQTLLLCNNDHERAMLHVLRAHNGRAIVLEEMEEVYLLDPNNRSLELLTIRELQELERDLLGLDFNPRRVDNQRRLNRPRPAARQRLIAFTDFVNRVVEEERTDNPDFWYLARGVLEMLAGDYFFAETTLDRLKDVSRNDTILQQVEILDEVVNVLKLKAISDSTEAYYYRLLSDEELAVAYPDLRRLVNDKLKAVYRKTGQKTKADLLQYGFEAIEKNPDLAALRQLAQMADSSNLNRFDRALLQDRIGPNAEDEINDLLGSYYLQRGQWKTALEIFKRIPAARRDDYGRFAPFVQQLNDRVNYVAPATMAQYNKVELLERLVQLEDDADKSVNDTVAARNYFNIGLALYNMTYFSYNWRVADAFRSGISASLAAAERRPDEIFAHPNAPIGNREHMSMDQPRYFFELALQRAPDRESAAQAAFYAAKSERNEFYAEGRPGGVRPFTYFRLLQDYYQGTEFYEDVVFECRTFAWFVGR